LTRSFLVNRSKNSQSKKSSETSKSHLKKKCQNNEAKEYLTKGLKWIDIDQSKAKIFFEKACKNSKKRDYEILAKASFELAQIHFEEKNLIESQKIMQQALRQAANSQKDMNGLISEIFYSLAFMMLEKQKSFSAQNYFENFIELKNEMGESDDLKFARAKLELEKLLLQNEVQGTEQNLQDALNIFKREGLSSVTYEAECYQLLGQFNLLKGKFDKVAQNNLDCLRILQDYKRDIDSAESLKYKIAESFAEAGHALAKIGSEQNEAKALLFLRHSLEIYNDFNEEQKNEASSILGKILVNALNILSKKSDKQESIKILESLERQNFQIKDFALIEDYKEFLINFTNSLVNLKKFNDGYKILKKNSKHFETSFSDAETLSDFYYLYCTLAYESKKYEEALIKHYQFVILSKNQKNLSKEITNKLFLTCTFSIKSQIKLSQEKNIQVNLEAWNELVKFVQEDILIYSVREIFLSLTEAGYYALCESFLLNVFESKRGQTFKKHKLIYTYLAILHSKMKDFSKTIIYSNMAKTESFMKIFNYFAKSSKSLLSKVIKNSTLMNECYKDLNIIQSHKNSNKQILIILSSLWDLFHQYIEKSDMKTSLILLEEINQILQAHIPSSSHFQGNIQILKILIGIEMGELENTVSLLKEVTEGSELSCNNDFIPLIYFLYGDVLKDLNSSEEAMLMWMKAVDTYLRAKTKESQKLITKNDSLFENLMSDRSDFLPDLYRRTVEKHFR